MTQHTKDDADSGATAAALSILVVRTGGFAGLRQQWEVEPGDDRDDWVALIVACPWDSVGSDPAARDRFVWRIEARMPRATHAASVPDRELVGPWRELVDRVQKAAPPAASPAAPPAAPPATRASAPETPAHG